MLSTGSVRAMGDVRYAPPTVDRNTVVEEHAYLIKKVAYKIVSRMPPSVEVDDLMSAGVVGLIDAAEKFEPGKSHKFSSYAEIRIRGAIIDELRALDWVPRTVRQKNAAIEAATRALSRRLGRPPTEPEIAEEMGVPVEEHRTFVARARPLTLVSYEDLTAGENEETRCLPFCKVDGPIDDPEQKSVRSGDRRHILRTFEQLRPQQRVVLTLYYYQDLSLKEIGARLGVTESRVSQVHTGALKVLRTLLSDMEPAGHTVPECDHQPSKTKTSSNASGAPKQDR